jgi:hypothetical protein
VPRPHGHGIGLIGNALLLDMFIAQAGFDDRLDRELFGLCGLRAEGSADGQDGRRSRHGLHGKVSPSGQSGRAVVPDPPPGPVMV